MERHSVFKARTSKMNCDYIKTNLLEYLDDTSNNGQQALFTQHLCECHDCQELVANEKSLRTTLRDLPVEAIDENFSESLFTNLELEKPQNQMKSFLSGFGSAIAAGLAIWFFITPAQLPTTNYDVINSVNISKNTVNNIRLSFDAPENFQHVTLSPKLPEKTELEGFPGQNLISWKTSLKTGKNILTLPILTKLNTGGVIEATISGDRGSKLIKLKMNIVETNNRLINI